MNDLDQTFAALSDPTRRAIVARLAKGDATVGELAGPFKISLPAISRHLKVLEEASIAWKFASSKAGRTRKRDRKSRKSRARDYAHFRSDPRRSLQRMAEPGG